MTTLTFDSGAYDETIVGPGGPFHPPFAWVESNGIRADGLWALDVGTPNGVLAQGHTHIGENWTNRPDGRADRIHAWTGDLQGLVISLESGGSFNVISIDYNVVENESTHPDYQLPGWATSPDDPQLLLSTAFDPTVADLESQWTAFSTGGAPTLTWFTAEVSGFDDITSFYLSHTVAHLKVDSIVLEILPAAVVPEPSTALLLGLGLAGLTARRLRTR